MGKEIFGGGEETSKEEQVKKPNRLAEQLKKSQKTGIKIDAGEGIEVNEELKTAERHLNILHIKIVEWYEEKGRKNDEVTQKIAETLNAELSKEDIAALAKSKKYERGASMYDEAYHNGGHPGNVFGWEWKDKNKKEIAGWITWG